MFWLQAAVVTAALASSPTQDTVLLDFYADWCGPCRQMDATIQELRSAGHPVRKVNIDQNRNLAQRFGVQGIPCFVMLVDGREVDRVVGATSYSRLERMCSAARGASGPTNLAQTNVVTPPPVAAGPKVIPAIATKDAFSAQPAVAPGLAPEQPQQHSPVSPERLIAATVRLRIQDPRGHSCGTGTIIDARAGEALVLTCGHIFRDSGGKGRIEVDLFGDEQKRQTTGKLIGYDLERDVALLSIRTPGPVAVARVAPTNYRVSVGDTVFTSGCNNGDDPTVRRCHVRSLDKFLGPPNIQVDDLPVEGRSGGGLFTKEGLVIGVCNAADPTDRQGLYAALATIHAQLEDHELAFVANGSGPAAAPGGALVAVEPPMMPEQMPQMRDEERLAEVQARDNVVLPVRHPLPGPVSSEAGTTATLSPDEMAALEEIRRRKAAGAEVICIIRSRSQPQGKSEILVLDDASPEFLQRVAEESGEVRRRQLTSFEIPR